VEIMAKRSVALRVEHNSPTLSAQEYADTLASLKKKIQESQVRAISSANKELIRLYWYIGKTIVEMQEKSGWGSGVIERLAKDMQSAFPGIEGFSRRNIFRMRAFYLEYRIVPQAVAQNDEIDQLGALAHIPWGHNVILIEKIKDMDERVWYAKKAVKNGWSRTVLTTWIESDLFHREGKAITNFSQTLPMPQSDMAQQSLKDPYIFDFLTLHTAHMEKDLEDGLVHHIQKFLLELGQGFAFMGRQYPIAIDGDTSYIDLLFYHTKLRCHVVIELKARAFKPEDVGQLNFYLSAVDDLVKHPEDRPTIGILLCKTRSKVKAEYAFRGIHRPMGVAEYEAMLTKALPESLKADLPTIQQIEEELGGKK
jgi:predicted nuclease of restriction endonuclease-like (RecB) superfamily